MEVELNTGMERRRRPITLLGLVFTALGVVLFSFLVYSVGPEEIAANIVDFGVVGFTVILALYGLRLLCRATAWHLSVSDPDYLPLRNTFPAVVLGEAVSSMVPLGILISGTTKAVAVRKRVSLVVGFSSVATENIFYSVVTSVFLIAGAITFAAAFPLDEAWSWTLRVLVAITSGVLLFLIVMVVRQWHFASATVGWLHAHGVGRRVLDGGREKVRLFEDLVYGFYRQHRNRFLPILLFECAFHLLGVAEVWFILSRIHGSASLFNGFVLESVSRTVSIVFKFVPFMVGVDEAGSHFVAEVLGIGAAIGVTLAIIRKGRILFWALVGLVIMARRGLGLEHIFSSHAE